MKFLKYLAKKHPAFIVQLVAVLKGLKPAVRIEFELHNQDYSKFIKLLTDFKLVWFEHSPFPVNVCYPSTLHEEIKKNVKIHETRTMNREKYYSFLRLEIEKDEYEDFWNALVQGELPSFLLRGGELDSSLET
ncbi:MAG: hypothetical protein ACXABK_05020, partial [Candidatus Heimdallarchaeaceae archaeon]